MRALVVENSPQSILKKVFGFDSFRKPQGEIVNSLILQRDALVVMPTGGGKSLCYQLPSLLFPHITIVVSPLIALMKDQVDALRARGIPAASLNSTQTLREQNEVFAQMESGELKLVYIAPERFRARRFLETMSQMEVSMFAVDEAHCLSQWGHDFRPDYLRLGDAISIFRRRPVVAAFTATATENVRDDIKKHLKMRDPAEFVAGFARPNLAFNIRHISTGTKRGNESKTTLHEAKLARLRKIIAAHRTGIIYCATRKSVERVADDLATDGVNLVMYHGGMNDVERNAAQDKFMSRAADVAVATNAFGMGIDRADIRFVAHYEMPGSIEDYYQESGRAGRDGAPAVCEMLFNLSDKRVQEFFIDGNNPDRETVVDVYETLRKLADNGNELRISLDDLAEQTKIYAGRKINPMAVSTSVGLLVRYHMIERFDMAGTRIRGTRLLHPDMSCAEAAIPWNDLAEKKQLDHDKLDKLIGLATTNVCRQEAILRYFGDIDAAKPCGKCDVCASQSDTARRVPDVEELIIVKKILSGVARMSTRHGNEFTPRVGRLRIAKCLLGSRSEATIQSGCTNLSTYGILKGENKRYVIALMDELLREGLLSTTEGEYPLCGLTKFGVAVMFGKENFTLRWPSRDGEPAPETEDETPPPPASHDDSAGKIPRHITVPRDKDVLSRREKEFLKKIDSHIGEKKRKKSGSSSRGKKNKLPPWLLAKIRRHT